MLSFALRKGNGLLFIRRNCWRKGLKPHVPCLYRRDKMGLIGHSYFMSIQSPYRYNFCQFGNADIKSCEDVVTALRNLQRVCMKPEFCIWTIRREISCMTR